MARKIKKPKLKLNKKEVIEKTETKFEYHIFNNALMYLQSLYMDYFIPKKENPIYAPENEHKKVSWKEIQVKSIKNELLQSFDFLIPIINYSIRASVRVFSDGNALENTEILKKSLALKTKFDLMLQTCRVAYYHDYAKNISSAYAEVEKAFKIIIDVFACYDIMNAYINNAQINKENRKYCKTMLTKWKRFKEQCIELIEEDEYNPKKQLKDLLEWQKKGNKIDKRVLNKLMIDSKKFA